LTQIKKECKPIQNASIAFQEKSIGCSTVYHERCALVFLPYVILLFELYATALYSQES